MRRSNAKKPEDDQVGMLHVNAKSLGIECGVNPVIVGLEDDLAKVLQGTQFQIVSVDAMVAWKKKITHTALSEVANQCMAEVLPLDPIFFERNNIDLSQIEEKLQEKYKGEEHLKMVRTLKIFLNGLACSVKTGDQEEISQLLPFIKDILGGKGYLTEGGIVGVVINNF